MKQLKPILSVVMILIALTFTLPSLLVLPFSGEKTKGKLTESQTAPIEKAKPKESATEVAVFRSSTNQIETLPLEEYVIGVVASEMPPDFEFEALKAQAITARTYITSHLLNGDKSNVPGGADVTDTTSFQVYKSEADLKKLYGKNYNWDKIAKAVKATEGEILTYKEKPIYAFFFSTSNGYTENAEDYWENQVPYLKSVESPWDSEAPKFESQTTLSIDEFQNKLGITIDKSGDIGEIIAYTPGKKIAKIEIGGKEFTGREIREKLGLRSTAFKWVRKGDSITITTEGYGHGVGMSQYGANGMAKEGKNYQDIVNHYYQGVAISDVHQYFDKKLASAK